MLEEEVFQTIPKRAWFIQRVQRKIQTIPKLTGKSPMRILFHYQPTCTSLLMPTKKKKKQNRQKKSERKELEEKKGKVKFEEVTLTVKPKIKTILIFWNLFSAHAWTSEADIYDQEQKVMKCSTCKQCFGQFWRDNYEQRAKHFLAKFCNCKWDTVNTVNTVHPLLSEIEL